MTNILILSASGGIGSAAFGLLYRLKPKHLPVAFTGGFITTFVMFGCPMVLVDSNLISNMLAALLGALFCYKMSYSKKAPFTVFMVPSLFPLVPGRALYFSMVGFIEHNKVLFVKNIMAATEIALGISVGIMLASIFNTYFQKEKKKLNIKK